MAETRTCKVCHQNFNIDEEDFLYYSKIGVPPPTLCPFHRKLRRLVSRNERKIYRRPCDLCKKMIIAVYDTTVPFPVYCPDCWWSDEWDSSKFAQDFNFSRPFFDQWNELNRKVPHISLWQIQNENSEYSHDSSYNKDCYMIFGADYSRDCYYAWCLVKDNDVCDSATVLMSERIYEGTDIVQAQFCMFSDQIRESSDCHFCFDLINCHRCFGSTGLQNKEYYWFNESLSKEEYEKRFKALTWSHQEIQENKKRAREVSLKVPRRYLMQRNCEDSTGHNIGFSKNIHDVYDARECRDCKHCTLIMQCKDLYDVEVAFYNVELCYESHSLIKNCFRVFFSYYVRDAKEFWYSTECYASANLFGCVGMRNSKFAILNKTYSKEEYKKMIEKITAHMQKTGEWGEFFPVEFTPLAYNESTALDYLPPLTKEEILKMGLKWKDADPKEYLPATAAVPEQMADVPDSITNEILACESCKKNYRIVPQELRFHREMNVPLPKKCFDCRHMNRLKRRGLRVLYDRICQKCGVTLKTIYPVGTPEMVYCEKCYLEAVY